MSYRSLLKRIASACDECRVPYMIIGGQAVMLHGEPRQTLDVDVTVQMSHQNREEIELLLNKTGLRAVSPDVYRILEESLVLPVVDADSNIPVELIFSPYGFEEPVIKRAVVRGIDRVPVRFISAEDLIVYKIVAGRGRDLQDVQGILERKGDKLNLDQIERDLKDIEEATGSSDLLPRWNELKANTKTGVRP